MKTLPAPSSATPAGKSSSAAVAGPPSPLKPAVPLPATIVIVPRARVHPPDARVARIRDEDVARAVERDASREVEFGRGGRPPVAAETRGPVARHGRDRPRARVHPPDARVARIRDEDVARAVERDASRAGEFGRGGGPAVAAEAPATAKAGVADTRNHDLGSRGRIAA